MYVYGLNINILAVKKRANTPTRNYHALSPFLLVKAIYSMQAHHLSSQCMLEVVQKKTHNPMLTITPIMEYQKHEVIATLHKILQYDMVSNTTRYQVLLTISDSARNRSTSSLSSHRALSESNTSASYRRGNSRSIVIVAVALNTLTKRRFSSPPLGRSFSLWFFNRNGRSSSTSGVLIFFNTFQCLLASPSLGGRLRYVVTTASRRASSRSIPLFNLSGMFLCHFFPYSFGCLRSRGQLCIFGMEYTRISWDVIAGVFLCEILHSLGRITLLYDFTPCFGIKTLYFLEEVLFRQTTSGPTNCESNAAIVFLI
jgi:hypothetical protein